MENGKLENKCYNAREVQWPPEKNISGHGHFWPPHDWLWCIEKHIDYNIRNWEEIDGRPMQYDDIDVESYYQHGYRKPDSCSHTYQRFMNGYNPNSDSGL